MKKIIMALAVFSLALLSSPAQAEKLKADKAHSEIRFEVQHIFAMTSGQFREFDADLEFDPGDPSTARFEFSVEVKSINTFDNKRDKHLLSKDFFDADKYPAMRFSSSKITHVEGSRYALEGMLTIKDVTKPLKIDFIHQGPRVSPFDKKIMVSGFHAAFELNRLDYHVGDGRFFKLGVVGDMVRVEIWMEALGKK